MSLYLCKLNNENCYARTVIFINFETCENN